MASKNFKYVIILSVLLIAFLAYQDIVGFAMFQLSGGWTGEAYQKMEPAYMKLFWTFALVLILITAGMYYLFRRDWSETIAIVFAYYTLLFAGLEDLLYYIFMRLPLDARLPWLDDNFFMGHLSKLLGYGGVTKESLILCIIIGIGITYLGVQWLKKQTW